MTRLLAPLFGFALLGAFASAQTPAPATNIPNAASLQIADEPGLPRVLLIGDSISLGYTLPVRERLQGRANIHHPPENCGDTGRGLRRLDTWLGDGRWEVIVFNFGLHDLKYLDAAGNYVAPSEGRQVTPIPRYEENLRELATRLKRTGAKLIYATTTPVPAGSLARVEHDERAYNATARRVMDAEQIPVLDLCAVIEPKQAEMQLPNNVHFTDAGFALLGAAVAARIEPLLPAPTR
jgi:GDSL-like Lipase/Acylhydrolase.